MKALFTYLESICVFPDDCRKFLSGAVRRRYLRRHDFLLKAGDPCNEIYFVQRGLLWSFRWEGERQICQWFMRENDIVTSVRSYFLSEPSEFCIQAMQTTELYWIGRDHLDEACRRYPALLELFLLLVKHYYCLEVEKNAILLLPSTRSQYQYIMDKHPWMIRDLPSRKIAAWLGTTEQHLSRIKRLPR